MRFCRVIVGLSLFVFFQGCTAFNYEWRQASKKPIPSTGITGQWSGSWLSYSNGHTGRLRALIREVNTNHYDVKFHATYKKGITFRFGYTVRMEASEGSDVISFSGVEDLGALAGGVYRYQGRASPTNFFSTYHSRYDHGIFEMQRPNAVGTIPVYSVPVPR